MSLMDGIFKNKAVQNMAFGQLRGLFADGKNKAIVIAMDASGELIIDVHESELTVRCVNANGEVEERVYGDNDAVPKIIANLKNDSDAENKD